MTTTTIDGIVLEKVPVVGTEWTNGHRDSWVECRINGIPIESGLASVGNEAPTPRDFELMQSPARTKFHKFGQYILPEMTKEFIEQACEWFAKH